jgi:tetrapyrrole methylase family protein/MazG family protein
LGQTLILASLALLQQGGNPALFHFDTGRILGRMQDPGLKRLFDLISTLRGENGCPWDREQQPKDILSDLIEETYELQWAHAHEDKADLLEEMGDVVFVLVFAIQLLQEEHPDFTLERITSFAYDKIKRRHPHVFGDAVAGNKDEGLAHWNRMKAEEKRAKNRQQTIFDDVPGNLSPLRRAEKIQRRAAHVGFDWPDTKGIFEKIQEETTELKDAIDREAADELEQEIGDLYFSVVNLSRFLKVDAEKAITRTNAKFVSRFLVMEKLIEADGLSLDDMSLSEMDQYWERAKG